MYMYIQYSMHVNVISIVLFYNITPTIQQINIVHFDVACLVFYGLSVYEVVGYLYLP